MLEKNSKSSKAIEADVVSDIGKDPQGQGIEISCMVGDDDSSAIKQLHDEFGAHIEKSCDINHVKKNLENRLYALKADGHRELSEKDIKYIQKCFVYALQQNKGDIDGLRNAFAATVPHMYGDHTSCDKLWCG